MALFLREAVGHDALDSLGTKAAIAKNLKLKLTVLVQDMTPNPTIDWNMLIPLNIEFANSHVNSKLGLFA